MHRRDNSGGVRMKIYRDPKNSLRMGVCNFNRVDEEKLFHSALDTMKKANAKKRNILIAGWLKGNALWADLQ